MIWAINDITATIASPIPLGPQLLWGELIKPCTPMPTEKTTNTDVIRIVPTQPLSDLALSPSSLNVLGQDLTPLASIFHVIGAIVSDVMAEMRTIARAKNQRETLMNPIIRL